MSYQVLARKYRPKILSELVGQDVLVQTLLSAIEKEKIPHAFILSGIRGVGKTTTARIIAKALNCLGKDGNNQKASVACGECSACISIASSKYQDVVEMDAASRTGVDDIREIIDNIAYATSIGRYRVYIIDEVHMLSNNAFNALLKTLEEPPSHVKFIFATTEIKKIPITIISRCQRFDLKRLTNEDIIAYLKEILAKESFEAEEGALNLIANFSEGSMRDALSLTDQALSYNNYEKLLSSKKIEEMVGMVDKVKIVNFFQLILKGKVENVIEILDDFYREGVDINSLASDLLDITHKATLMKTIPDYQFIDMSQNCYEEIKNIAENISVACLARMWQMIYILRMPNRVITGTSLLQIVFVSINVTLMQAIFNNSVDVILASLMIIGSVIGVQFGIKKAKNTDNDTLKLLLALLILFVCLKMASGLFLEPSSLYNIEIVKNG